MPDNILSSTLKESYRKDPNRTSACIPLERENEKEADIF